MKKEIAVSVICYNNENEVIEFAAKLSNQKEADNIVLLITCNKCRNSEILKSKLQEIKISTYVYNPGENLGYLHGCLYGLREYNDDYNWAVISNTDISFASDDFFLKLLKNNSKYKDGVVCVAPDIVLKDTQIHQNPFALNRPDRKLMRFRRFIYENYLLYSVYFGLSRVKKKIRKPRTLNGKGIIYGAHGSIVFLRKECINDFLSDDFPIFMYGEELYIAEKLRSKNQSTYYDTDLKVIHNEHQSTGKTASRQKLRWQSQSVNFLIDRYW